MDTVAHFTGPIYRAQTQLSDVIPLAVHLVKGPDYAVWIDSGTRQMYPQLLETMALALAACRAEHLSGLL